LRKPRMAGEVNATDDEGGGAIAGGKTRFTLI
jgi:hypothetical protein